MNKTVKYKAGIVITTRNRQQDLQKLFSLLSQQPAWAKYPIWIHDDASDQVDDNYWQDLNKYALFIIRNPRRYGAATNRNISNTSAPFEYIFSLDDDSCFVDIEGPDKAIEYMENHPNVAALSFPTVDSFTPPPLENNQPYPCLSYGSCAALIRQSVFTQLGGYYSNFFYYGEEPEFCWRIWAAGYEVHAFPACRVNHWVTSHSRTSRQTVFYGFQNRIWSHILHTPISMLPLEIARAFASSMRLSLKTKIPLVHLSGCFSGIKQGILYWRDRQALPLSLYHYLTSLPIICTLN